MQPLGIAIVAVVTPLVLVASGPSPSDACSLLTPAEAGAVLGEKILPGQHPPGGKITKICLYSSSTDLSIGDKKAIVAIITVQSFNNGKIPMQGITKTPVSGIGDDAIFIITSGFGSGLNVRKGDVAFQIRVNGGKLTIPLEEEMEKALANEILKRL
jgi:hypothetical protein